MYTRRRLLLTGGTLAAGTAGGLTLLTQNAEASLTMGSLNVQGASKSLDSPPTKVTLSVSGRYELVGSTPDQSRVVLQVEYAGTSRDMNEQVNLDNVMTGDYTLSADLLAHPEVEAQELLPAEVDATTGTQFTVRVILLAVSDGYIENETFVEDTAMLSLTKDGLELAVSGEGGISVSA